MTLTNIDELIEKLNAPIFVNRINPVPVTVFVNPDGPAAAAALSTLQEQKRKLEEALRESRDVLGAIPAPHSYPLWERMCRAIRKAEIALGGEA